MANNTLLDTRTTVFGELVGNGRIYQVPLFQRDYAWRADNWEDLWQDILAVHETKTPHFMGAIVTQRIHTPMVRDGIPVIAGGQYFSIIDGQQRLATLSILAIAVIHKLQQLVENGVTPEANRERQEILRRTYLGNRDPQSLRYASKLFLNANDNGFYQDNLINLRPPRNIYTLTASQRLLWEAFEYFSQALDKHPTLAKEGTSLANLLTDAVAQRLLFIQIAVEDEINAYVVFETLNSRGVALSATDLLKNYLFSILRGPDDFYAAQRQWQALVRIVGMEAFPDFLKCFLSMTRQRVRRDQVFKLTRQRIHSAESAFELLDQLSEVSELSVALKNPNDDFWLVHPNHPSIRASVRALTLFGAQSAYPALFAAYKKFDDGKFDKLLKLIAVIAFRYVVVSNRNPNELERQCNALAVNISSGNVKSPKAAFDVLSSLYVEDDPFKQNFSALTMANQSQKALIKYILRGLEREASGKDVTADSFSIEHILPQNPDALWRQSFSAEADDFIYRLGNMTLLEPSINRALGRSAYSEKQIAYRRSAYQLTKTIQAEDWVADSIVRRQERMAQQAAQIWRIAY